jgi:hypothetical protein
MAAKVKQVAKTETHRIFGGSRAYASARTSLCASWCPPQFHAELRALIQRMSADNPLWGAPRMMSWLCAARRAMARLHRFFSAGSRDLPKYGEKRALIAAAGYPPSAVLSVSAALNDGCRDG